MNNKLYVGQLPFSVDSDQLAQYFSAMGEVVSAKVITDRESGRSKGFGFVEMATEQMAENAIENLNGSEFSGRNINVSIAKPQEPRQGGGGGGGRFNSRGSFGTRQRRGF